MISMLQVEGIRAAQEKFGIGKHMTPEQVQWGLEHLDLTQEKLETLGLGGIMRPVKPSCADHMGTHWNRFITRAGGKFKGVSDWYQTDKTCLEQPITPPC